MKKTMIIQSSILTATLFLNSGCFFGYFGDQLLPNENESNRVVRERVQESILSTKTVPQSISSTQSIPSRPQEVTYSSRSIERESLPLITPVELSNQNFPRSNLPTSTLECSDNINAENGCEKELIQKDELEEPIKINSGGEIHSVRTVQGRSINIEEKSTGFLFPDYPNKIIVLEMFGKNCEHCIKEIPVLNRIRSKYGSNVEVIAVQVEDKMSVSEAKRLIRRYNIHYPIVAGDSAKNLQYNIQTTYGWTGILPFTLVIKDGVTEFNYRGEVSYNTINKDIRSIIR